ncbi:TadE/TadG family type IV pilus assembly protein [Pyruvatibacter sp.]|uniref:TadE/TadG family type IV pilus assembly protein n=1 Tax=Pyruvatibacter sp. TaxID=1981328 RepID=UPI0032EFDA3A
MKQARTITPGKLLSRRVRGGVLRRFRRSSEGSSAVEFALLAMPFFGILFATLEATAVFFASVSLETGAAEASRMVRTGQVQLQGLSREDIRNTICDAMFMGCDNRMQIDVRRFDNFSAIDFTDPLTEDGDLRTDLMFQPGNPGDIVLVRVFYVWEIATPFLGAAMSNMSSGSRLIISSAAFRNEPFGNAQAAGG